MIRKPKLARVARARTMLLSTALFIFGSIEFAGAHPSHSGLKWKSVAQMSTARLGHAMIELPPGPSGLGLSTAGGKVLVIGGFDSSPNAFPFVPANPLASCEIYDPGRNSWTPAAPHPISGGWRWAVVLRNGMVLVAGGLKNLESNIADSHLYDPKTDRWIATKPLPIGVSNPHGFMRPIVLPNGQVLIAGGEDDDGTKAVMETGVLVHSKKSYLFTLNERNPALSSWDFTRSVTSHKISLMPEGRTTSALILMRNGLVLNVGGLGPAFDGHLAATNTASVFNPRTGLWSKAAPMPPIEGLGEDEIITPYPTSPGSRWAPFVAELDDGQILIAGGTAGVLFEGFRKSAVLYDPSRNKWRTSSPMHFRRFFGSWSARLPSDAGILFAGAGLTESLELHDLTGEIFNQRTRSWTLAPADAGPPADGSVDSFESQSVFLSSGELQVTGGADFTTDTLGTNGSWIFGARSN